VSAAGQRPEFGREFVQGEPLKRSLSSGNSVDCLSPNGKLPVGSRTYVDTYT